MSPLMITMVVLYVLSFGVFCVFRTEKGSVKGLFAKAVTSVIFVITAILTVTLTNAAPPVYFALLLPGLLFGLIGDIALDLKYVDSTNSDSYTYAGMGVFAVGHVFFLAAVIYRFSPGLLAAGISAAIAAAAAAAMIIGGEKFLKFNFGKFKLMAVIYSFLLIFFAALSVSVMITAKTYSRGALFLMIGSIAFFLSDAVLSGIYFGGMNNRAMVILNHVLYYAAQILIVFSLV